MQLLKIKEKLDTVKLQVESLCALQDKQDGLLENIFNGDYGSELEEKLESEVDLLMQKKQKISGIHMTWVSSRELISLSCTQMLWSVNRWKQIAQYPQISNQVEILCARFKHVINFSPFQYGKFLFSKCLRPKFIPRYVMFIALLFCAFRI